MTMNRKQIIIGIIAIIIVFIAVFAFRSRNNNGTAIAPGSISAGQNDAPSVAGEDSRQFVDSRFTFVYPKDFAVSGSPNVKTKSWRIDTTTTGYQIAVVTIPKSYMPGTNFSDAKLTIGVSNDKAELGGAGCPAGIKFNETGGASAVTIHGQTYTKVVRKEAAAGNLYETTSFFTVRDGDCYAIEYTIHSTNIANYPAEQGIKEFDKEKIVSVLENIVKSFTFTINSD
jgi:hypothetical protein